MFPLLSSYETDTLCILLCKNTIPSSFMIGEFIYKLSDIKIYYLSWRLQEFAGWKEGKESRNAKALLKFMYKKRKEDCYDPSLYEGYHENFDDGYPMGVINF